MLSVSHNANPNYLCRVVKIDNIRKHSNADRLQIVTIDGANIIVGLDAKLGDIMVFVPTECQLAECFVRENNLFEDKSLNKDTDKKGYINNKRRVRAIKLRGEYSRALLLPVEYFKLFFQDAPFNMDEWIGVEFDTVCGVQFSTKYEPPIKCVQNNAQKKKTKADRIVPDQFHFHVDTLQLVKNLDKIKYEDIIHVSHKLHGTSGIAAYIKVNKKVPWWKSILYKILGEKPQEYDYVASSRKVIRDENSGEGFYGKDVWTWALNELKPHLAKGMTLYFEIVGYVPGTDSMIQKGYDYGCNPGEAKIFIYRITNTNEDGIVFEWPVEKVNAWCVSHDVNHVPTLMYDRCIHFLYNDNGECAGEKLYNELVTYGYMEKNDPLCKNKVPYEGHVIRVERFGDIEVYKIKANAFYEHESKMLDNDDIGMDAE